MIEFAPGFRGEPPFIPFSSDELEAAHGAWGCNCGPASLAACLEYTLPEVRKLLPHFRGFMNPTEMQTALALGIGAPARKLYKTANPKGLPNMPTGLPSRGVARVQFGGPWLAPDVPPGAAYKQTHWVATLLHRTIWTPPGVAPEQERFRIFIFDVNAGWQLFDRWWETTIPQLIASDRRRDGRCFFTHAFGL